MDSRVVRCNHLIKKIQKGNEKALDEMLQEYGSLFLNVAKKYLVDKTYAEDLISEMFLDLVRTSARSFDERKNGLNWIFTIIRNKALRHNREYSAIVPTDDEKASFFLGDYMSFSDEQSERNVDALLLRQGMEKLSDEENKILYYKYWECLTVREIAKKTGKPRSTIQYEIDKILKKLKKYCDFEG